MIVTGAEGPEYEMFQKLPVQSAVNGHPNIFLAGEAESSEEEGQGPASVIPLLVQVGSLTGISQHSHCMATE